MTHDKSSVSDKTTGTSRRRLLKAAAWASPLAVAAGGAQLVHGLAKTANAQSNSEMTDLSARDAVEHIKNGDMKAEAYVGRLLKHHETHKNLNALITLDEARVLEEARAVDQARARGDKLGALAGLPFVVKDQIDVVGYPTSVGSSLLEGYVATKNAVVVETMLNAGAVMMAKTNMSDLLTGGGSGLYFPMPRNPYDLSRDTGGSSTGVGGAIGARIAPAGIGEDSAGSIRWPAAWCGISGLRPSTYAFDNYFNGTNRKRYSGLGMVPPTTWMDTMGPMARTVADVAFLDTAITGDQVPTISLRETRIGIPRPDYWDKRPHDSRVKQVTEDVFAKLRDAGVQLIEVDLDGLIELSAQDRLGPLVTQGARPMSDWLAENLPSVSVADITAEREKNRGDPEPRNYFRPTAPPAIRSHLSAEEERAMMEDGWAKYSGTFKDNGIVALAMPTMLIPPTLINFYGNPRQQKIVVNGERVELWDLILTNVWWGSRFGAPALSLPAGLASTLPVGLQLQGMPGTDSQLLGLGIEVEKVVGPIPPPTFRHVPI